MTLADAINRLRWYLGVGGEKSTRKEGLEAIGWVASRYGKRRLNARQALALAEQEWAKSFQWEEDGR